MIAKNIFLSVLSAASVGLPLQAMADFGDADFPAKILDNGPQSYHDAWCRKIGNKCRVRFQGDKMWVEGQGGITNSQYQSYRYNIDGAEYYNYIRYVDTKGNSRSALFLFVHGTAQDEFMRAFVRWKEQNSDPAPNYRYPASQGPQETHGRDKSFGRNNNPYDNEPITDWSETTQPW